MRTIADSQSLLDARDGGCFADSSPADLVYVNLKNALSLPMHWSLKEQYGFDEVTLNTVCYSYSIQDEHPLAEKALK